MKLNSLLNDSLGVLGYKVIRATDAFQNRRAAAMIREQIDLVIDVGANSGQYGREIRRYGYRGRLCSFEPLARPFSELADVAGRDEGWCVSRLAIGERKELVDINISANSQSSSILAMLSAHVEADPESKYVGAERVEVRALDDLWGSVIPTSDKTMLKIDTQGYEAKVISGAMSVLPQIRLLECELSFVRLYAEQPLFQELFSTISQLGFTPVGFNSVFEDPKSGLCLQVDGLFARSA